MKGALAAFLALMIAPYVLAEPALYGHPGGTANAAGPQAFTLLEFEGNYYAGGSYLGPFGGEIPLLVVLGSDWNVRHALVYNITEGNEGYDGVFLHLRRLNNGILAVGVSGSPLLTRSGNLILAKLDKNGNVEWFREYVVKIPGITGQYRRVTVRPVSVEVNKGGIYVLGEIPGPFTTGMEASLLMKFDLNGNLRWAKIFGRENLAYRPRGLVILNDGTILTLSWLVGMSKSWMAFVGFSEDGNVKFVRIIKITNSIKTQYEASPTALVEIDDGLLVLGKIGNDGVAYALKLDYGLNKQWGFMTLDAGEGFYGAVELGDTIVLAGLSHTAYSHPEFQVGNTMNLWLVGVKDGNVEWSRLYGYPYIMRTYTGYIYVTRVEEKGILLAPLMHPKAFQVAVFDERGSIETANMNDLITKDASFKIVELKIETLSGEINTATPEINEINASLVLQGEVSLKASGRPSQTGTSTQTNTFTTPERSTTSTPAISTTTSSTSPKITIITSGRSSTEKSSTTSTKENPKKGTCGPVFIVALSILPLLWRRR